MKKIFLLLILLCPALLDAQSFTASPNDSVETYNNVNDWVADYIYIHNTSGASMNVSFSVITNTMDGLGWDALLCTSNGCFSYVPSGGSLGVIANGDSGHVNLHCGFVGIAGTGEVKIKVYETGNASNAITVTFRYHAAFASGVEATTTSEEFLSQNFPNPFSISSSINYNLPTSKGAFKIFDVTGKQMRSEILNENKGTLEFGEGLGKGVFLCALSDENGKAIAVRRIIVQ